MKAKELIELLQAQDPELEVWGINDVTGYEKYTPNSFSVVYMKASEDWDDPNQYEGYITVPVEKPNRFEGLYDTSGPDWTKAIILA